MATRLELQGKLETLLGTGNVYYQPPETVKMKYPAIIYSLDDIDTKYANNRHYIDTKRYSVTYVSRTPDDGATDEILKMPLCAFERHYAADNLHHYVYTLYY